MERYYSVSGNGTQEGKVLVKQQGLYYDFSCRCRLSGDVMYRLQVTCGSVHENLGILVPKDGCFVLHTKIPVKRLGTGDMFFTLLPKQESVSETFVPIHPEEPFAYISRLKRSFLQYKDGQPGISIQNMQEC